MKATWPFKTQRTTHPATQYHIQAEQNHVSKEYWQNAQHIIPQTGHEENLLAAGQV
jgi:hypothetical protein